MLKLIRGIWREFNCKRKNASVSFDSVLASFCIHRPSVWGPACSTRHLGHSRMCSSSSSSSSSSKNSHQGFPIPDPFSPNDPNDYWANQDKPREHGYLSKTSWGHTTRFPCQETHWHQLLSLNMSALKLEIPLKLPGSRWLAVTKPLVWDCILRSPYMFDGFPLFVCLQMVSGIIFRKLLLFPWKSYVHVSEVPNISAPKLRNVEHMKPPGYTTLEVRWMCLKIVYPNYPMVLLIIIPMKNGYFIGNINPTFSDKPSPWQFPV